MGKFGRDRNVARNFNQIGNRTVCRFLGGQSISIICAAVALAVAYAPDSKAQLPTQEGPSVSLASLTNSGAVIISGDKAFTDFFVANELSVPDSLISVTPILDAGNFGIQISGPMYTYSAADLTLDYEVSVTNSPNLISVANLAFNGVTLGGTGTASVVEQVYTNNSLTEYGTMTVYETSTGTTNFGVQSASLVINPPQPLLYINKDVELTAFFPADSSISDIYQTYTQVPEPSALALVAAGLSGLFLLRRRKR